MRKIGFLKNRMKEANDIKDAPSYLEPPGIRDIPGAATAGR